LRSFPARRGVDVVVVRHTLRSLRAVEDRVFGQRAAVQADTGFTSVYVDVRRNRVVIGIPGAPTSQRVSRLRQQFGATVDVEQQYAVPAYTVAGGSYTDDRQFACTAAFNVNPVAPSAGAFLTAGHCFGGTVYNGAGRNVGTVGTRKYFNGAGGTIYQATVARGIVSGRYWTPGKAEPECGGARGIMSTMDGVAAHISLGTLDLS
jgi:hypothetical protein